MINVIIVDDDNLVALSLKTILEANENIAILATGECGQDAIQLYKKYIPDILLMDIRMEELNGLDAGLQILSQFPKAKILFLTTFSDDEYILKAIHMGAKGYILKQNFECIAPSINAVYNGQTVFGTEIIGRLPEMINRKNNLDLEKYDLSEKEFEIIRYVADGMNNREIAAALFLSEGTIRNYLSIILEKLQLRDRTQLAVFYYKHYI